LVFGEFSNIKSTTLLNIYHGLLSILPGHDLCPALSFSGLNLNFTGHWADKIEKYSFDY
jgi:hypothetical protein